MRLGIVRLADLALEVRPGGVEIPPRRPPDTVGEFVPPQRLLHEMP
jgi:hypothetical protein